MHTDLFATQIDVLTAYNIRSSTYIHAFNLVFFGKFLKQRLVNSANGFRSYFHEGRPCFCVLYSCRIHCMRASFQEPAGSSGLLSLIVQTVLNDNPKKTHSCFHLAASELHVIATPFQSSSSEKKI